MKESPDLSITESELRHSEAIHGVGDLEGPMWLKLCGAGNEISKLHLSLLELHAHGVPE